MKLAFKPGHHFNVSQATYVTTLEDWWASSTRLDSTNTVHTTTAMKKNDHRPFILVDLADGLMKMLSFEVGHCECNVFQSVQGPKFANDREPWKLMKERES